MAADLAHSGFHARGLANRAGHFIQVRPAAVLAHVVVLALFLRPNLGRLVVIYTYNVLDLSGSENCTVTWFKDADGQPARDNLQFFEVSFDATGGSSVPSQLVAEDGLAAEPAGPQKEGYAFVGWYTPAGTPWDFGADRVTENVTLEAQWSNDVSYLVRHYQENPGGAGGYALTAEEQFSGRNGEAVTARPNDYAGYVYYERHLGHRSGQRRRAGALLRPGDLSRDAARERRCHRGGTTPSNYTYSVGAQLPEPTRDGYVFAGWYDNEACTGEPVEAIGLDETGAKEYFAKGMMHRFRQRRASRPPSTKGWIPRFMSKQPKGKATMSTAAITASFDNR